MSELPDPLDDGISPWVSSVFRALGYGVISIAFVWPLASSAAVLSAALGAALGATLGGLLARQGRLRPGTYVLLGFGLIVVALGSQWMIATRGVMVGSLGPESAMRVADAISFGIGVFGVSVALSGLASSRPWVRVVEVALAAVVLAELVRAHRDGSINRPFELADPMIASGQDPMVVFFALGAFVIALIVMLLIRERSLWRLALHGALVGLLVLGVLWLTEEVGMPAPPEGGGAGMGLRGDSGDDDSGQGGRSESQGDASSGQRNNDELEFREHDPSSMNPAPVAIMLLHDDYSPPSGVYYLRQGAFSRYNGRRLVRALDREVDDDIATGFPTRTTLVAGAPALGADRVRLETTVALLAEHSRPFALESVLELKPARNPSPERFRRVYRVVSGSLRADYGELLSREVGNPQWSEETEALYVSMPEDERYGQLASDVISDLPPHLLGNRVAQAMMITHWLGEVGRYTTRVAHSDAQDPTADFLFGDRTGYCVHFAHAATFMMRSQGLPARVATGYAVDEAARNGGSALMITGQSSHAWPEVFIQGLGWVPFDVSPQTVLDSGGQPPDPELQRLLGQLLREEDLSVPDEASVLREAVEGAQDLGKQVATAITWLMLLLLSILTLCKLWRALAPRVARGDSRYRSYYRASLDRLSEVGVTRRRGESREEFAARIASEYPSFAILTRALEGDVYGSGRPGPDDYGLKQAASKLHSERRDQVRLIRRVIAAITPWSWLRSR